MEARAVSVGYEDLVLCLLSRWLLQTQQLWRIKSMAVPHRFQDGMVCTLVVSSLISAHPITSRPPHHAHVFT